MWAGQAEEEGKNKAISAEKLRFGRSEFYLRQVKFWELVWRPQRETCGLHHRTSSCDLVPIWIVCYPEPVLVALNAVTGLHGAFLFR